jgi:hypothetical protein
MDSDPIKVNTTQFESIDKENLLKNDVEGVCPYQKPESKKCCFVELNPGVSYFNLYTYYLVQFSYVCACTFLDATQNALLTSEDYYNIDKTQKGSINGDILLFDTLYLVSFFNSDLFYIYLWYFS